MRLLLGVIVIVSAAACRTHGAFIDHFVGANGPALGAAALDDDEIFTDDENNDNTVFFSPNLGIIDLTFAQAGHVDIVMQVEDGAGPGVTEYDIDFEILNLSGAGWRHVRMSLGFGGEVTATPFVASGNGDALDFDTPHKDSLVDADNLASFVQGEDFLELRLNPSITHGDAVAGFLSIDVPHRSLIPAIPATAQTATGYLMTLRLFVPEPFSSLLWLTMITGGVSARRRGTMPRYSST